LGQFVAEAFHGVNEDLDVALADQPGTGLDIGQGQAAPVVDQPGPSGRQTTERFVASVYQLLAGSEETSISRIAGTDLFLLLGGEGIVMFSTT
jgi:hypothetical protein